MLPHKRIEARVRAQHLHSFVRDEKGEDLIEYGLLAAFVATIAFAVIITDPLGTKTAPINPRNKAKSALDGA